MTWRLRSSVIERGVVREVVALAVRDRHTQHRAALQLARERRVVSSTRTKTSRPRKRRCSFRINAPGSRPTSVAPEIRCRCRTPFHPSAACAPDRLHHRRELRQRAGAKVIAVREPAGNDDAVGAAKVRLLVPQHLDLGAEHIARHMHRIVIAIRAGQDDDAEFHAARSLARRCDVTNPDRALTTSLLPEVGRGSSQHKMVFRSKTDSGEIKKPQQQGSRVPLVITIVVLAVVGSAYYMYYRQQAEYYTGRNLRLLSMLTAQVEGRVTMFADFVSAEGQSRRRERLRQKTRRSLLRART